MIIVLTQAIIPTSVCSLHVPIRNYESSPGALEVVYSSINITGMLAVPFLPWCRDCPESFQMSTALSLPFQFFEGMVAFLLKFAELRKIVLLYVCRNSFILRTSLQGGSETFSNPVFSSSHLTSLRDQCSYKSRPVPYINGFFIFIQYVHTILIDRLRWGFIKCTILKMEQFFCEDHQCIKPQSGRQCSTQ